MGSGSDGRRLSVEIRGDGGGGNRDDRPRVGIAGPFSKFDFLAERVQRAGFPGAAPWESGYLLLPMQQKYAMFRAP